MAAEEVSPAAPPHTPITLKPDPLANTVVSPGVRVLKAQALARAAYSGDLETIETLLEEGVSPDSTDAYGCEQPHKPAGPMIHQQ